MRQAVIAACIAAAIPGAVLGAATASAQPSCTDQIDYSGDPRSNAEINSIGGTTGVCPTPQTGVSNDVEGLQQGAVIGQPCSSFERYIFGELANGDTAACARQADGTGVWVNSIPVIGTRPLGTSCVAGFSTAAQSPEGIPMICSDGGAWIRN